MPLLNESVQHLTPKIVRSWENELLNDELYFWFCGLQVFVELQLQQKWKIHFRYTFPYKWKIVIIKSLDTNVKIFSLGDYFQCLKKWLWEWWNLPSRFTKIHNEKNLVACSCKTFWKRNQQDYADKHVSEVQQIQLDIQPHIIDKI